MRRDDPHLETRALERRSDHPYAAEIEAERRGWYELAGLVRLLTPEECLVPGYYAAPDWTVRDVVAHLGPWLAEAEIQLERMSAGTYRGHDVDIDALNAAFLVAMRDQPWEVAWIQANAGRTRMLEEWYALSERTEEAAWWVRKAGAEHYTEHLGRLREWVAELLRRRAGTTDLARPSLDGPAGDSERHDEDRRDIGAIPHGPAVITVRVVSFAPCAAGGGGHWDSCDTGRGSRMTTAVSRDRRDA